MQKLLYSLIFSVMLMLSPFVFAETTNNIPILCYHNFNPVIPGSMSITPKKFEAQLKWLKDNGFTIIPLKEAVEYLQGTRTNIPAKSIVITMDDGWQSVYKYMFPLVRKYNIPVTLFIYPQTISTGKNSMTWDELREMQRTGLFDVQGHTYSHPNFKQLKKRMSPAQYEKLVNNELVNSKKILEEKMGKKITLLAWPFGIYNDYLEGQAAKAGYEMSFTIDARTANRSFKPQAQPRYMIIDGLTPKTFYSIANSATKPIQTVSKK